MIRLGVRLALSGGREAAIRLVAITIALALGVGMLLVVIAGANALHAQNVRAAWLGTVPSEPPSLATGQSGTPRPSQDRSTGARASASHSPLWWLASSDEYRGQSIERVDVAVTGPGAPRIPGVDRLPLAGRYVASPALEHLMASVPRNQLADRFPAHGAGIIGAAGLASPDSLVIVVGYTPRQLSEMPGAGLVRSINAVPARGGLAGDNSTTVEVILAVGACALLLPVLLFVGTAMRLSAARREQRFAAMRLVGATPRQLSTVAAVEAVLASLGGVLLGVGLFASLHSLAARLPLTGARLFPGDLSLSALDLVVVIAGVPLAAALAALVALRSVRKAPLEVSRQATRPALRARRLLPLVAGVALLAGLAASRHPGSHVKSEIPLFAVGFVLTLVGLIVAGPWLTSLGPRAVVARTGRPSVLLAGRRLSEDPRGAFRSVSGLVVAVFVTTVAVGAMATLHFAFAAPVGTANVGGTVVDQFVGASPNSTPLGARLAAPALRMTAVPGVTGVAVIHTDPQVATAIDQGMGPAGLVACNELQSVPALGTCPRGAAAASITPDFFDQGHLVNPTTEAAQAATRWPLAPIGLASLQGLPVDAIVVATNGSPGAIERVRTALEVALPGRTTPLTIGSLSPATSQILAEGQRLADIVVLASLIVAGCNLAVGIAGGLIDRKRPFSLLRLTGTPLGVLRSVVAFEGAVPLIAGSVAALAVGIAASELLIRAALAATLRAPGGDFYAAVAVGIAGSLMLITLTFPLLARISGPEEARFE